MKKNILAENMLRFGVKNLSESDVTRLSEAGPTVNDVVADMNTVVQALNSQFAKLIASWAKNNPEKYGPLMQKIGKVSNNPRSYNPFSFQTRKGTNLGDSYQVSVKLEDGQVVNLNTAGEFGRPEINYNQLRDLPKDLYQNAFINGLNLIRNLSMANKAVKGSQLQQLILTSIRKAAEQLASSNVIANRWQQASDAVGTQAPE